MAIKFHFTKADIDALPLPDAGRIDYQDKKVPELVLRVSYTGSKTFTFFRKVKGKLERITLGRYPQMTIDQARRRSNELNVKIADGYNPAEEKRTKLKERTFADLFNEYIERHAKTSKKTWSDDVQNFNLYLVRSIGPMKLTNLNRSAIASVHSAISRSGKKTTANRILALISSVFGWSIDAGLVENNPANGIRRNKERTRDRFIQGEELPRFFQSLADEPNETIRDYVLISLLTGARKSNVLSMQWKDINLDRQEWRIKETKNGTPQVITLSPEAIEVLINRKPLESTPFVFPGIGKTNHLAEPKKGWKRILERAGIEDLRIHDLRRTLGSWQAKTGASMAVIGKSLNHKSHNTTAIYARLDLDPVRQSVNTATSAMMNAAGLSESEVLKFKKKS